MTKKITDCFDKFAANTRSSFLVDGIDKNLYFASSVLKDIASIIKVNFDETVKRNSSLKGMYRAIDRDFFNDEISTERYIIL